MLEERGLKMISYKGRGAFGKVFHAREKNTQGNVAVKFISNDYYEEEMGSGTIISEETKKIIN